MLRLQILVHLLLVLLGSSSVSFAFHFDQDKGENCPDRAEAGECIMDSTTFYECAQSCTKKYHREFNPEEQSDGHVEWPGYFYSLQMPLGGQDPNATKKKMVQFERFEDYIVLVAVVPLLPGMAHYMYDALDHLQKTFPYTLEVLILPLLPNKGDEEAAPTIVPKPHSKVIVTEPLYHKNNHIFYLNIPVLNHLSKNALSSRDRELDRDRVTVFVVSINGKIIERMEQPSLVQLDKYVAHYQRELDMKRDL
jgi:hypothetical protein